MKFRYTFRKNWQNRVIYMTSESMHLYFDRFSSDKDYKVVKREIFTNGKWSEII